MGSRGSEQAGHGGREVVLDHVAVGVWRFEDAIPVVVEQLGGQPGRGGPGRGFTWRTWVYRDGGKLEILEPAGPPGGFLHRFLHARGPGIHHVTFYVPSLREACDHAEANGYAVTGYDDSDPGWQEAFLHPKQALGVVVQLASSSPEHEAEGYGWDKPAGPAVTPEPVMLAGLRTTAPSAREARRLWETTLGGEIEERSGGLRIRWADSPLHVSVHLDAELPPGPVALEVESGREVSLLDRDPPPSFGARLIRAAG